MNASERPLILVIDDRADITSFCERSLGDAFDFRRVPGAEEAERMLAQGSVAAVLLDRDFSQAAPGTRIGPADDARNEGLHILQQLRHRHPRLPVVMVTGLRDLTAAVRAADLGADFLAWEDVIAEPASLRARLNRALEATDGQDDGALIRFRELGIIVESPSFRGALMALHRALPGRAPILLLGETGTGKDSLAHAVHVLAGDGLRPYVAVNVASLNPNLIESELFGHARGAFTGAERQSVGKLRFAHRGTLFLNEVGDLSLDVQAKLLTVLERSEVVPVGEVRSQPAEFRLVAATSRDLRALVEQGRFRRDLFHRLAWHTIEIPPLRERREDVKALVLAFLSGTIQYREGQVFGIAREAIEYLEGLPWPGNVRELRGMVEAACACARHTITVSDVLEVARRHERLLTPKASERVDLELTTPIHDATPPPHRPQDCASAVFGPATYRDLTAAYFAWLFQRAGGRLSEVARLAGISKATAYEWRDRYGATSRSEPDGTARPTDEGPPPHTP